jgi:predicted enzyme related to lactoylglutathione lyase
VDAACEFYRSVLGWETPSPGPDDGGYVIALMNGQPVVGIGPKQSPEQPVSWLLYLATDDVDKTAEAVTGHGGALLLPPADAGEHGRLLVAADPTGALFGAWQAGRHIGASLVNEPGGIVWEDLRSADPAAAQSFYGSVFGYDFNPIDMAPADYRTFHLAGDEAPLGGMGGFMGPPTSSHWLVYFGVPSTDRAVDAAERAGGTVISPPFSTPYGRMAGIQDPYGAVFHVTEPGEQMPDRSG